MPTRILLLTVIALLTGCEDLGSFVADEEAAALDDASRPYNDYQQVAVEPRNIRVAVEAA